MEKHKGREPFWGVLIIQRTKWRPLIYFKEQNGDKLDRHLQGVKLRNITDEVRQYNGKNISITIFTTGLIHMPITGKMKNITEKI